MSTAAKAAKGGVWTLGQILFERCVQACVFLLIAHRLGANGFGLAAIAVAPAVVLSAGVQAGNQVLVRGDSHGDYPTDAAYVACVLIASLMALCVIVPAALLMLFSSTPLLGKLMLVTAVVPLLYGVACVPDAALFSRMQFGRLAARRSFAVALAGAVCVALSLTSLAYWALPLQLVTNSLTSSIISLSLAKVYFKFSCRIEQVWRVGVRLLPAIGTGLLNQLGPRAVDVILGSLVSVSAAGVYRVARTVLDLATSLFFNPIANVLIPLLTSAVSDKTKRSCLASYVLSVSIAIMSVVYSSMSSLFAFFPRLLLKTSTNQLAQIGAILSPSIIPFAVVGVSHSCLIALQRAKVSFRISSVLTCVTIITAVSLSPLGVLFVCAGLTATAFGGAAMYLYAVHVALERSPLLRTRDFVIVTVAVAASVCSLGFADHYKLQSGSLTLRDFAPPMALALLMSLGVLLIAALLFKRELISFLIQRKRVQDDSRA